MTEVQRWYQGYRYNKTPKELIEKISKTVQENEISAFVPLLRIQKGAKGGRQYYYFFLAIEGEEIGNVPQKIIDSHLLKLPFFKTTAVPGDKSKSCFNYEQIKEMVGVAHQVEDYTNPIPYKFTEQIKAEDPFDLSEFINRRRYPLEVAQQLKTDNPFNISFSTRELTFEEKLSSKRYQQLLYWLSAVGSGTWELFKKACQTLELNKPQHILRKFKLLGHIETSSNGKYWAIAPTALVKINFRSENQEFILCGQQNGDLLNRLEQYATVNLREQHNGDAPPCVSLQFIDSSEIEQVVKSIQNSLGLTINQVGDVANQLTDILPTLENWESRLQNIQGIVPSIYSWKLFDGQNFVDCPLPQQTGMYQMCEMEENSHPRMTLFYNSETGTWKQGDWYGLRFLALHYSKQTCIAHYDFDTARLTVPFSQRWPQIYERALVLTSGKLPSYNRTDLGLIYENVPSNIVQQLTAKLHVTCNL